MKTVLICNDASYVPREERFDTIEDFVHYCESCFDEAPSLVRLPPNGIWVDEDGAPVLTEREELDDPELSDAVVRAARAAAAVYRSEFPGERWDEQTDWDSTAYAIDSRGKAWPDEAWDLYRETLKTAVNERARR